MEDIKFCIGCTAEYDEPDWTHCPFCGEELYDEDEMHEIRRQQQLDDDSEERRI